MSGQHLWQLWGNMCFFNDHPMCKWGTSWGTSVNKRVINHFSWHVLWFHDGRNMAKTLGTSWWCGIRPHYIGPNVHRLGLGYHQQWVNTRSFLGIWSSRWDIRISDIFTWFIGKSGSSNHWDLAIFCWLVELCVDFFSFPKVVIG